MKTIRSNDLKKGDLVALRSGWKARIEDNKKGNIRLATVYGYTTEMGSVYSHDIMHRQNPDGSVEFIEMTKEQQKLYRAVKSIFL